MTGVPTYFDAPSAQSDDIALLRKHINTVPFDYVDVATQEAYDTALKNWTLLAELAACRLISQPTVDLTTTWPAANVVDGDLSCR